MSTTPLDLSGLGAEPAPAPPPSKGGGIDLSGLGATPAPAPAKSSVDTSGLGASPAPHTSLPAAAHEQGSWLDGVRHRAQSLVEGAAAGIGSATLPAAQFVRGTHAGDFLAKHAGLDDLIQSDKDAIAKGSAPDESGGHEIGQQLENMLEYEVGLEAAKGLTLPDKLARMTKLAKFAEANPRLARVIAAVTRNAAVGGTQAAAHGGSASDVAEAAATSGGTAALFHGVPEAVGHKAESLAPTTTTIADEPIPTLRAQQPGASKAAKSVEVTPQIEKQQQQGAANATRNIAQKAAVTHITRVNESRTPASSAEPYTFTLDAGDDPRQRTPGSTPEELQQGQRQENARAAIGSTAATVPESVMPRNPVVRQIGSQAALVPDSVMGPRNVSVNEPLSAQAAGSGKFETTDPTAARAQLSQLEDAAERPDFKNLSPRLQGRVNDQIESLRQQLAEHAPRFTSVDPEQAANQVHNFRDLADQMEGSVSDVFDKANEISGGQFSALRGQQKAARAVMNKPTSEAAYNRARASYAAATDGLNRIFEQEPETIQRKDWDQARQTWRLASAARDLHSALQSSFEGPPEDVAARTGLERKQLGGPKAIDALNRVLGDRSADIRELIGDEGVDNLYRVADLLKRPKDPDKGLPAVLREVSTILRRHGHTGIASMAGGAIAHGLQGVVGHAMPTYYGYIAGAGAGAMYSRLVNEIATNPALAKKLAFPVKQGVSPRIAASIIASQMMKNQRDDKQAEQSADPENNQP